MVNYFLDYNIEFISGNSTTTTSTTRQQKNGN
jgi:hypothetical protein